MKRINIKSIPLIGVFAALCAVLSQICVPVPWCAVPITLQIFGVMLAGFCLKPAAAAATMVTYILLGLVGAPVFSGFTGGASVLLGPTGGFIWGFIALALVCALSKKITNLWLKISFVGLGLIVCHALGVLQYSYVTESELLHSFLSISLPFIIKDSVLGAAAYIVSLKIARLLRF